MTMKRSVFEAELEKRAAEVEAALATASEDERAQLEGQRVEIARRLADVEGALKEREARVRELEALLDREGNEIGGDRLTEARTALEQGDFSQADDLFAEIEAREQMAVQSAAHAAYGRGEIAEEQVRWGDAAEHYARAARLELTFSYLRQDWDFAWKLGRYERALIISKALSETAVLEFGEESLRSGIALSCRGLSLLHLGRHGEAEPLFRQALEIGEKITGTAHPDYATRLNNLALLLLVMGRFDKAEPLYVAALEIFRAKLGPDHPTTKLVEANYAAFLAERDAAPD